MERQGLTLGLRSVITSSERLLPLQRETIERQFGGRVSDHYGMAERVAYAIECEHGTLHIHPGYSYVEIVDEAGRPTDGPGYVVGTTFHNLVMPLVRYRLNDMAQWDAAGCPCGRSFPVFRSMSGKIEDQLYDADNEAVSPSVVTFAFKGVPHIARSQVAQVGPAEWRVRVVPLPGFGDLQQRALLENFSRLVTDRVRVAIDLREDIPAEPSGKYKWVSQEFHRSPPRAETVR
jgi:phenylacetate-CoA ligase